MKKWKQLMVTAALCSALTPLSALAATEGSWVNDGRQFMLPDGSIAANQWIDGGENRYYYVGGDGNYVTGWRSIPTSGTNDVYDYYFNADDGAMFYSAYTPDGYYVNEDGVKIANRYLEGSEAERIETEKQAAESRESSLFGGVETYDAARGVYVNAETGEAVSGSAEAAAGEEERLAVELFNMINDRRMAAGLASFAADDGLKRAAAVRAAEIAAYTDEEVAANAGIIYDRPEEHALAGMNRAPSKSSVTAVEAAVIAAYNDTARGGIILTELPVWKADSTDAALKNMLGTNRPFLLDDGTENSYGFNSMGAACKKRGDRLYFSVFIGKRQF